MAGCNSYLPPPRRCWAPRWRSYSDPAYLTALSDAACGGEVCGVEFRVRRNIVCDLERGQGNSVDFIWVEMRCKALGPGAETASPSQEGLVAVLGEVTERKNQEQALDLARTAAEQAEAY